MPSAATASPIIESPSPASSPMSSHGLYTLRALGDTGLQKRLTSTRKMLVPSFIEFLRLLEPKRSRTASRTHCGSGPNSS